MKNFESELQEIREWEDAERYKLKKEAEEKYGRGFFDGVSAEKLKAISREAFEKAMDLKKKYNRTSIY